MYVCVCIHVYTYTYTYMDIYTYICIHLYIHVCVCIHICVCVCIHIYAHTYRYRFGECLVKQWITAPQKYEFHKQEYMHMYVKIYQKSCILYKGLPFFNKYKYTKNIKLNKQTNKSTQENQQKRTIWPGIDANSRIV